MAEHRVTLTSDFDTYRSDHVLVWCTCDLDNPIANLGPEPTPADTWRIQQEHLAAVAPAPDPVIAGILVAPHLGRRCPDDGACHHGCTSGCFRVGCCGPLSGVYPEDEWPVEVVAANLVSDGTL